MEAIEIGKKYKTPFEPSGIVEVIRIESEDNFYKKPTCIIKYIGDHPAGYKNGTEGRYFCDELKQID